jgi:hypothetical protein
LSKINEENRSINCTIVNSGKVSAFDTSKDTAHPENTLINQLRASQKVKNKIE